MRERDGHPTEAYCVNCETEGEGLAAVLCPGFKKFLWP